MQQRDFKLLHANHRNRDCESTVAPDLAEASGKLQIVYIGEEPPPEYAATIFLAVPRHSDVDRWWRSNLITSLGGLGYDGVVFVPDTLDGNRNFSASLYADWRRQSLNRADVIVWWFPPQRYQADDALEYADFGYWLESGKSIVAAGPKREANRLMRFYAERAHVPVTAEPQQALALATARIGKGARRAGAERDVPLHVWQLPQFQSWYRSQKDAGNELSAARVVWVFRLGGKQDEIFSWAVHVDMYVKAEDRHKANEVILGRPDITSVVLYRAAQSLADYEVVLVREFRSQARTVDGYVLELPGGSRTFTDVDPRFVAVRECAEETGLRLGVERLKIHEARQLASTFSVHQGLVFSAALSAAEMARLKADSQTPHGLAEETERTFVRVQTVGQVLRDASVDWSTVGMIMLAVTNAQNRGPDDVNPS